MKWREYENVFQQYKTDVPDKTIKWAQSKGWGFRGELTSNWFHYLYSPLLSDNSLPLKKLNRPLQQWIKNCYTGNSSCCLFIIVLLQRMPDMVIFNQVGVPQFFLKTWRVPWTKKLKKRRYRPGVSNTRPRAACGPPDALVWPANTSKNDKSIKFDQI